MLCDSERLSFFKTAILVMNLANTLFFIRTCTQHIRQYSFLYIHTIFSTNKIVYSLVRVIGKFSVTKWSSWNITTTFTSNSTLKLEVVRVGHVKSRGNTM